MISTRASNDFLGLPLLGRLQPGAPADLVVLSEDPTESLGALDSIVAVVRDGRLYTREALDAQRDRYTRHFDSDLYTALLEPVVRFVLARTVADPTD